MERTRAGLEVARKLGRTGGRKRQMTDGKMKVARKLLASGVPARDVASHLGVSFPLYINGFPRLRILEAPLPLKPDFSPKILAKT